MSKLYIHHHLGLGDHLICNGIVGEKAKHYDEVFVYTKKHNVEAVKFLFRDICSINILSIQNDAEVIDQMTQYAEEEKLSIGAFGKGWNEQNSFDQVFYEQAGVSFSKRWSPFVRDLNKEKVTFESLKLPEEYIFLHEDPEKNYLINRSLIKNDLPIVCIDKSIPFFDYGTVIENAKEVHCMESSYRLLTDILNPKGQLFFHWYVRRYPSHTVPQMQHTWTRC